MNTIQVSKYGIAITPAKGEALNNEVLQLSKTGEPFTLDFSGVRGIDSSVAYQLKKTLQSYYGPAYRGQVQFMNVAPIVNNMLVFSSSSTTMPQTHRHPKHSVFTSAFSHIFATILLLLTLGVGQMWGGQNNCNWRGNVFFRAPNNWDLSTNSVVQVAIVRTQDANTSEYVCMLTMERIGTTRLYYKWVELDHNGWNQSEYLGFIANPSEWGDYEKENSDRRGTFNFGNCACYVTPIDWGVSNDNVPYLFNPTSESNGATLSGNYNDSGSGYSDRWYSLLDKAQTVNLYTSGSSSNAGGIVTIAGTYMSAYNTTTATGSATSSSASVNYTTLIGSSVTLTATPGTGYQFDGWYTAGTGGSLVSNSNPYSYTCTGEATVYARFSELTYSLTFANSDGHGTVSVGGSQVASAGSSGSASVNYYTTKTLVATPSTGYNFSSWTLSGSNTSAVTIGSTTTASTTIKATNTGATVTAGFTPKNYTITLDKNGGDSNGSATATYNSSTFSIASNASRTDHRIEGYYAEAGMTNKVVNADGTLVASVSGYTNSSSQWIKDADVTLYANWIYDVTEYAVTYAVGTGYTSYGSISAYNTTTSSALGASPQNVRSGHSVRFTATPNTGYAVEGWYTDAACTAGKHDAGSTTYTPSITDVTNVYVKFVEQTWSVAFAAGTGGTVTTPAATPQTVGQLTGIAIAATPATGYTFASWSSSTGGSFTSGTSTNSNTFKPTANTTVTASFNETMHTVSITNGTGSSTVGIATKATVTASAAATGKKFKQWNITGTYTLQDATTLTSREIHFTATTDISITAEYEDRDFVKVYFAKPSSWTDGLKVYAWDGNETPTYKNAEWPGVACTTTETVNCVTYYYYLYYTDNNGEGDDQTGAENWTTMIFSDNGNDSEKTADLTIADGHFYRSSTTGSGGTDGHDWYVRGAFNSVNHWNDDYPLEFDECGATGTVTITGLTATSQLFKIYRASTDQWFKWTGGAAVDYDADKAIDLNTALTLREYNNNNNTFTPASTLSYTFTLNTTSTTNPVLTVAAVDATSYSTTMSVSGNGSTTPAAGSITLKQYTPTTITATPATGYYFTGWTEDGGHGISFASSSSATTTATATSAGGTVTANFAAQWAVVGGDSEGADSDDDEMGDWSTSANQITYIGTNVAGNDTGYVDITLPANTTYYFKVKDVSQASNSGWYGNSGSWTYANNRQRWDYTTAGSNSSITTAGAGTYRFSWNMSGNGSTKQDSLRSAFPTSYTVTFGYGTGGSAVTATVEDATTITSGQYAAAGKDITFTQTPAAGYTFKGWYTTADDNTAVTAMGTSDPVLDNIAADATVYAQYTENMTTVTLASTTGGHIEIADELETSTTAGVYTTRSITAVPDEGWYFAGWTVSDGADCKVESTDGRNDNESQTTVLSGLGAGTTGVVTANFVENDKIYFRNIFDDGAGNVTRWSNVYVHFDIDWADYSGKQAVKTSADNSTKGLHVAMTQIGSSDVYWAYVPRYITANSKAKVAFADHEDPYDNSYLWEGMASGRGDYSPLLNMFVPYHSSNETGVNGVNYYSNGYWMKYDTRASQGAGYYLKKYKSQGNYWQPGEFIANTDDATTIQFKVRLDNVTTDSTRFMIVSAGGLNYLAASTPTSTACSDIELNEDTRSTSDNTVYFQLTATSEGYYTFIIDQTGDKMKLTVYYPVSPGDYRLVHTYTGRNIANTADSTYTTYSDVIKGSTATESKTLSMYLNRASTSLVLQKCTEINSTTKLPTWSTGDATNLSAITTAVGTNSGVYQFDVTVDTSTDQVSAVNHIGLYTGNYYIKTDCATGGWTAYTQNVMEKNNATFSSEDASTYDYFYCKWVDSGNGGDGGGTNVKCVIANDYCNAVSDTLEGDDILGGAQILPKAANVRFSYNSTTNTLKRTYINGATGWESSFLSLKDAQSNFDGSGGAMITHFGGTALTNDTLSFVDMNNWIYQRDLKAKPGSRIRLTANYKYSDTDHEQYLIGQTGDLSSSTTVQIIGGETDEFIPMRAIYDFKTNNLIVGYLAYDENVTTSRALNADVLIVREDQGDAAQITFGNNVHFTEVDTVYGILELKKSSILDENMSIYERALYWISFPFDVKLGDVFCFGEYGKHWMIQYYDGAARAENGFWAEVETYWKWVMPNERANFTLEANKGYLLGLDLDEMTSTSTVWGNNVQSVSLYFPSSGEVGSITWPLTSSKNVVVQTHECTIERDDRWYKDANWNVIGVPSYANWTKTVVAETAVSQSETLVPHNVPFLYRHNTADNTLVAVASSSVEFKSMQAYVVQYAGTIDWTTNAGPFAAPKRTPEQNGERNLTLHLNGDNETADHTFIRFTHEEGITEGLDMNKDLTKEFKPQANIYSLVPGRVSQVQLAANLLPADYTTTTVEVGVRVAQDGYYTFSMPSTDGLTVVLYDRLTETRTNLLIGTYRAELSAGTTNGRFVLEIGNAQAPTAIQSVGNDANGEQVIKFVQDGQLYILKNGRVFNAEGKAIE
ncbi:MAG: InlB B-repeat-containing protein [Paludibacteraceae bacterium]|nr:InlB B-repeat-containing protein [Paludibacteraceae bacterium]